MSKKTKNSSYVLLVLHDLLIFLSTLLFMGWILLKLRDDTGIRWLNIANLYVTGFFGLLFLIKLLFLNSPKSSIERSKKIKFVFKIIKYSLKVLLLSIIIVGLLQVFREDGISHAAIAATIAANFFFLALFAFDTYMMMRARRKKLEEKNS